MHSTTTNPLPMQPAPPKPTSAEDQFFDAALPWRTKQFFTCNEVAELFSLSANFVRDLITSGDLPAHQVLNSGPRPARLNGKGRRRIYRIPRSSLLLMLARSFSNAAYSPALFDELLRDTVVRLTPAARRELAAYLATLPQN